MDTLRLGLIGTSRSLGVGCPREDTDRSISQRTFTGRPSQKPDPAVGAGAVLLKDSSNPSTLLSPNSTQEGATGYTEKGKQWGKKNPKNPSLKKKHRNNLLVTCSS